MIGDRDIIKEMEDAYQHDLKKYKFTYFITEQHKANIKLTRALKRILCSSNSSLRLDYKYANRVLKKWGREK